MKRRSFLKLPASPVVVAASSGTLGIFAIQRVGAVVGEATPAGIRPCLQTALPDSIRVSWWSDSASTATIEWGTDPLNLTNTVSAATDNLGAGYRYHTGVITGLQPGTSYHYRVHNGTTPSAVFRFRTPPPVGTRTGKLRALIIGDNQISSEPRWEILVRRIKPKIEQMFCKPIKEVIDIVLNVGDQVDVGTNWHYRNVHFAFSRLISPDLPFATEVGNHETYSDGSLAMYRRMFLYDGLTYQGIASPNPTICYAFQQANIHDVQKTLALWSWQIAEFDLAEKTRQVDCWAEGNVRFSGDARRAYNSRQVDSFHRKLGLPAPGKPSFISPPAGSVTLPVNLQSSAFASTAVEALNSTWFQVAKKVFAVGEAIPVDFEFGPRNPRDWIAGGETIRIDYTGAKPVSTNWIGIYRVGLRPGLDGASVQWGYAPDASGTRSFSNLAKGYDFAAFMVNDPYFEVAERVYFPIGSEISSVSTPKTTPAYREDFDVSFSEGPGTPKDYVGISRKGEEPGEGDPVAYLYVGGVASGTVRFTEDIEPGDYWLALLINDTYSTVSNRTDFTVGPRPELVIEPLEAADGGFRMAFSSEQGVDYRPWKSPEMAEGSWNIDRTIPGTGGRIEMNIPMDENLDRCFYKLERID
jgi:hypothetical protein